MAATTAAGATTHLFALQLKIEAELFDLLLPAKYDGLLLLLCFTLEDSLCALLLPNLSATATHKTLQRVSVGVR